MAQVWSLHDVLPEHLRPAILLGAFVGLRAAEVVGLRWGGDLVGTDGAGRHTSTCAIERAARSGVAGLSGCSASRSAALPRVAADGSGLDVTVVHHRLRQGSAKTTLAVYGHLWPDSDESARAAINP